MRQARLRPQAREDIFDIWTYIASDNAAAADAVVDRLDQAFAAIATHPKSGRLRPDLGSGVRSYVVGNYVIFYRIAPSGVDVGRVMHGARNIGPEEIWRGLGLSGGDIA